MCPSKVLVAVFTGKKEDMDKIQRSYSLSEKNQKKKRDEKKGKLKSPFLPRKKYIVYKGRMLHSRMLLCGLF